MMNFSPHSRELRTSPRSFVETFGPVFALLVLVIATAAWEYFSRGTTDFLKLENWNNILRQWSFVGIVAIGMTFVIILGGIDLSVGSLVALAGGTGIWLMNTCLSAAKIIKAVEDAKKFEMDALPHSEFRVGLAQLFLKTGLGGNEYGAIAIAFATCLAVGLLAGLLNGAIIAIGKLAPFIATLGGLAAYRSLAMAIRDGGEFRSDSTKLFSALGTGGIPIPGIETRPGAAMLFSYPALIWLSFAIVMMLVLNKTVFGRHVRAVGGNEKAALYAGINTRRIKLLTYTLAGFCCGLSAMLVSSRLNSVASSSTGTMYELDAIAAVVIGGTRLTGGKGSILGTIIGVIMIGVIGNMLNQLQVSTYLQGAVKGAIIVSAALIQRIGAKSE